MDKQDYRVLIFLSRQPQFDHIQSEIIKGANIGNRTLYRVLKNLEELNLIKLTRTMGKNNRSKMYQITEAGINRLKLNG